MKKFTFSRLVAVLVVVSFIFLGFFTETLSERDHLQAAWSAGMILPVFSLMGAFGSFGISQVFKNKILMGSFLFLSGSLFLLCGFSIALFFWSAILSPTGIAKFLGVMVALMVFLPTLLSPSKKSRTA